MIEFKEKKKWFIKMDNAKQRFEQFRNQIFEVLFWRLIEEEKRIVN